MDRPLGRRVAIVMRLHGREVARGTAETCRSDLVSYGDGRYGWALALPFAAGLTNVAIGGLDVLGDNETGAVTPLTLIPEIRDAILLSAASTSIAAVLGSLDGRQIEARMG